MFKERLSELKEFILQTASDELYERVVRPEKIKRDKVAADAVEAALNHPLAKKAEHDAASRGAYYTLGHVDPFQLAKSYTTFSGVDVQLFFTDVPLLEAKAAAMNSRNDIEPLPYPRAYGNAQGVSWHINRETNVAMGTIIDLVIDSPTVPEGEYITVFAVNEYGKAAILFEGKNFKLTSTSSGMTVDDIIMEQSHTFNCDYLGAGKVGTWEPSAS